jgi:hypothetical protein
MDLLDLFIDDNLKLNAGYQQNDRKRRPQRQHRQAGWQQI